MTDKLQKNEKKGFVARYAKILVAFAVLCGAMSGSFGALITAPATVIGFWRLTIALPFFAVPILAKEESRAKLFSINKNELLWCVISGFFLFLHFFSWFNAVKMTNVSSAAVLASLHPLVVLLITVFIYKKKVSWKSVAAIFVALIGGAIIMCSDLSAFKGSALSGNLFAFGAAMFMGIYFAIGDKVRKTVDGSCYVLLVFASCWVWFMLANLVMGVPLTGYPSSDYLYMICLAFICQIGSHALFNMCIGNVSSLYVSTWEAGDPVFSTLVAMVLVQQIPRGFEIIGCIIVVAALLLYSKFEREQNV